MEEESAIERPHTKYDYVFRVIPTHYHPMLEELKPSTLQQLNDLLRSHYMSDPLVHAAFEVMRHSPEEVDFAFPFIAMVNVLMESNGALRESVMTQIANSTQPWTQQT